MLVQAPVSALIRELQILLWHSLSMSSVWERSKKGWDSVFWVRVRVLWFMFKVASSPGGARRPRRSGPS